MVIYYSLYIINLSAGELTEQQHAVTVTYTELGRVQRGHEGQRKGTIPTLTPTWKLLIKAQTAHGIQVAVEVTLANNNDFQTIL